MNCGLHRLINLKLPLDELMFEGDAELLRDFVVEANEGLAEIESDLLAIEEAGADIDSDLVNKVFRAIIRSKGPAGFLALKAVEQLSHSMENVLSLIRSRTLIPTDRSWTGC